MDEKIYELLLGMEKQIESFRKETNERFNKVDKEISSIKSEISELRDESSEIHQGTLKIQGKLVSADDKYRKLKDEVSVLNQIVLDRYI